MDDKTAKIPSLKDFQKSQTSAQKRKTEKKQVSKSDTHRLDTNRRTAGKSGYNNSEEVKTYRPGKNKSSSSVSGTTLKLDKNKIRNADSEKRYPEERYPEDKVYERKFQTHREQSLTQTRVAGRRPPQQRLPVQNSGERRPPANTGNYQRNEQRRQEPARNNQARPPRPSGRQTENLRSTDKRRPPQPPVKKRKKPMSPFRRKVRRIMVYILIVLGFLLAGLILSLTVLFKTEKIDVKIEDNFYSAQEIISASGLHYQDNIFMSDKSGAEKKLLEKFPYIKDVKIKAIIPDTININVEISKEAFAVRTDNLIYIANENSKVLNVIATADEVSVPIIEGVKVKTAKTGEILDFESEMVKDSLTEMFTFAEEKGYTKITKVDLESHKSVTGTDTIEIRYVYDDRIVVYMGIPENISYKMQTAQTIITEKLDVNGAVLTGELDVSQCYDSKKSYFNQYSLIPDAVITEPSTDPTATTEAVEDEYYEDVYYEEDYYEEDYPEDEIYEEGYNEEEYHEDEYYADDNGSEDSYM